MTPVSDPPGRRRPIAREVLKPRGVLRYGRKTLGAATPLVLVGPPAVLVAYSVTFLVTSNSRVTSEFFAAASQIIPVLLLVLAVEAQVFRWRMAGSTLLKTPKALYTDERNAQEASGEDGVDAAVEAVIDAAVETADALTRQLTALLLLTALLVGEIVALIPLLTGDPGSASAKPVMAAIVAGLAGVAYVAITGSPFLRSSDAPGERRE
jgi:hypothetical protein